MKRWQYTEENISENLDGANILGEEGWELVAVVYESKTEQLEAATIAYFKRELVDR